MRCSFSELVFNLPVNAWRIKCGKMDPQICHYNWLLVGFVNGAIWLVWFNANVFWALHFNHFDFYIYNKLHTVTIDGNYGLVASFLHFTGSHFPRASSLPPHLLKSKNRTESWRYCVCTPRDKNYYMGFWECFNMRCTQPILSSAYSSKAGLFDLSHVTAT